MKTIKKTLGIIVLTASVFCIQPSHAQKRNNNSKTFSKTERVSNGNYSRVNYRYRAQPIRRNPAYRYPVHRRVITTLPVHHVRIVHRGLPYFYYSGVYYTALGSKYIVVLPPRGFRITVLPVNHIRIVVGTSVYFYHSGVYYTEIKTTTTETEGKYEVTQPPIGATLYELPDDAETIFIDGKIYYEFNDVLYKKSSDAKGKVTYTVVYSKSSEE